MAASGKLNLHLKWEGNCGYLPEHDQQLALGMERWKS